MLRLGAYREEDRGLYPSGTALALRQAYASQFIIRQHFPNGHNRSHGDAAGQHFPIQEIIVHGIILHKGKDHLRRRAYPFFYQIQIELHVLLIGFFIKIELISCQCLFSPVGLHIFLVILVPVTHIP